VGEIYRGEFSYGTVIAACCFSIQAIGVGVFVAFGVFFNPLMDEFGWTRATISGASSLAFLLMGVFGIAVGRLNDRFGPRLLMSVTAVFLGLGYVLMSRVVTVQQLYLYYGIIFGIGLSSIDVIALTTIARWFSRKRGMMTGIVKVGTGAGQFTVPLVASALIACCGWRNAYMILGSAALVMLLGIAQLLKRDPSRHRRAPDREKSAPGPALEVFAEAHLTLGQALRTLQLWIICLVNLAIVFCMLIVLVHIVPHARDIGIPAARAATVLSAIGAVSMVGRFATGMFIDRIGSKKAMIFCFLLLVAALFWLQLADSLWMLYLFAAIYGLAHGGFFTAISPIVAEMFGIGSHGALFGIVVCFGTIGGASGPILAGYIFDIAGSYHWAFWLITLLSAAGLGLILMLKPISKAADSV
jgi:MFS family permease